jgi:recombination protein RecA
LTADQTTQFKEALAEIHRRWGNEALRPLSSLKPQAAYIPTGYSALDSLIKGGIPCGRITEINGSPTSGMTTLAMKIIAQAQSQGRIGIYVDLAGVFDPGYAVQCGVQLDGLLIARPLDISSALDILQIVADAGGAGISVLDHILVIPHSERLLGAGLRRLSPALRQSGFTALLLNPGGSSPALVQHAALRLACEN